MYFFAFQLIGTVDDMALYPYNCLRKLLTLESTVVASAARISMADGVPHRSHGITLLLRHSASLLPFDFY